MTQQKQRIQASDEVLIPRAEKVEGADEMNWVEDGRRTLFSSDISLATDIFCFGEAVRLHWGRSR